VFGINAWLPTIFMRHGFTLVRSFNYTLIIFSVAPFSQFIGIWLEERIKRKYALLLITVVGMALFICFGMSFQYHWPVKVLVGSQLLETLIINGAMGVVYTIIPEVFPTPVRALGFGLVQALGRSGAVVGPLALGIFMKFGTQISDIIYYFAAPITIAAILVAIFIKQDPRQRTLESVNSEALKEETSQVATAG
jgi:putative MFS transporter